MHLKLNYIEFSNVTYTTIFDYLYDAAYYIYIYIYMDMVVLRPHRICDIGDIDQS